MKKIETYYPNTKDCIGNIYEFASNLNNALKVMDYTDSNGKKSKITYALCKCNGKTTWFNLNLFHSAYRLQTLNWKPAKLGIINQPYDNMLMTALVLAGKKLKVVDVKKVFKPIPRRSHRKTTYAPVFEMI